MGRLKSSLPLTRSMAEPWRRLAATGQEKFHKPFQPMPAGFVNVEYNNIEAIKKATNQKTCAVMLEPVQGEGGVLNPFSRLLQRGTCLVQ